MLKRFRSIRDGMRHRRIARTNPLDRIPRGLLVRGQDVFPSQP